MTMISKDIFLRLIQVSEVNTLKELSKKYGHNDNWATNAKNREAIPFDICVKVAKEKGVTMDYLLFGTQEEYEGMDGFDDDINKLKQSITDGIYQAERFEILTINGEWRISTITDMVIGEIMRTFKDTDNKDKIIFENIMKKLKED